MYFVSAEEWHRHISGIQQSPDGTPQFDNNGRPVYAHAGAQGLSSVSVWHQFISNVRTETLSAGVSTVAPIFQVQESVDKYRKFLETKQVSLTVNGMNPLSDSFTPMYGLRIVAAFSTTLVCQTIHQFLDQLAFMTFKRLSLKPPQQSKSILLPTQEAIQEFAQKSGYAL